MDETGRTTVPTVGPRLYMLYERFCDVTSQLGTTCSLLKELVTECKNTPYELSFRDEMTQVAKLIMLYDRVFGITSQLNTTCCLVKDLATEYQHLPDTLYRAEQFKRPEHMSLQVLYDRRMAALERHRMEYERQYGSHTTHDLNDLAEDEIC